MLVNLIKTECHSIYTNVNLAAVCSLLWIAAIGAEYSALDTSPLSIYVMHPFWNKVVLMELMGNKPDEHRQVDLLGNYLIMDSWTAVLIPTCMYSIFGRTTQGISAMRFYFCLWNVFINFHLSHWEKYNTGVLFLPWGYDASMLVAIIIFLMTSICGHKFWTFRLPGDLSAGQMFELTFYICALASNLPMCIWNCRLIVSQMSSTRCEIVNWLLVPMAVTVVLSISLPSTAPYLELALLYILTTLATIAHIHYGTCVVRQMCKHFRIDCFRIRNHGD
ncbi:LOW QUALITY PROTEIN: Uncharacterized protein GBIM_09913 [Gryllus bimaculatus]|nr:LOW QUALITY PROTEIN: Uncharacterized protein GBIM_09913 [Gryllus bimaculatus]